MRLLKDGLARDYRAALLNHLGKGGGDTLQPALGLGRRALVAGLDTLDLARIHDHALTGQRTPRPTAALLKRGMSFFNEALIPIVETHRTARAGRIHLDHLNSVLHQRTHELATMSVRLERGIARRRRVETALKKSTRHYSALYEGSLKLQRGLRRLTRQVLMGQEDERKRMSLELKNEVAQSLLGINVRLLALKEEARQNTRGLKKEIAGTQLLVADSVMKVRKAAKGLRNA